MAPAFPAHDHDPGIARSSESYNEFMGTAKKGLTHYWVLEEKGIRESRGNFKAVSKDEWETSISVPGPSGSDATCELL